MTVHELSREQLTELKQNYYCDMMAQEGAGVSYGELAEIDDLVTDETIKQEYEGYVFGDDDFFCSAGHTSGDDVIDDMVNDLEMEYDYDINPAIFAI